MVMITITIQHLQIMNTWFTFSIYNKVIQMEISGHHLRYLNLLLSTMITAYHTHNNVKHKADDDENGIQGHIHIILKMVIMIMINHNIISFNIYDIHNGDDNEFINNAPILCNLTIDNMVIH